MDLNFVTIDFETANNDRASICSVGIAIVKNGNIIDSKYWLVRPGKLWFHPFNTSIHGITADNVKDKPQFCDIWQEMLTYLNGNVVLAHNASFDIGCIRDVLNECGIEYPSFDYSCTRNFAKKAFPNLISYSLSAVADYLNVDFSHHHAEQDAIACAIIALRMCDHFKSKSIYELAEQLDTTVGKISPGSYSRARLHSLKRNGVFRISDITSTRNDDNIHHPFYNKQLVFTGTLHSMPRREAIQEVVNVGGYCKNTIAVNTRFLVVGEFDYRQLKDGLHSNKLKKANEIISAGGDLELLTEDEFLNLLKSH